MLTFCLIAAGVALVAGSFIGVWHYLDVLDRRHEAAEIARIKALPRAGQLQALKEAQKELRLALWNYSQLNRLWAAYKWGYRNNPYFIPRFVAQIECARLHSLAENLSKALTVE
ncbi:MAG: hypothetical protein P4L53_05400 [Candidatus Obscuribacterales bacterium]|nr:hypothetical protein [Candidatus Obscuribacterales bacterium]